MFENINEMYPDHRSQDIRKSRMNALLLISLSTLSALVILSLWLFMFTIPGGAGFTGSIWLVVIITCQWLLVIGYWSFPLH